MKRKCARVLDKPLGLGLSQNQSRPSKKNTLLDCRTWRGDVATVIASLDKVIRNFLSFWNREFLDSAK